MTDFGTNTPQPPWRALPLDTLRVLQRIAKDPGKGARPFFQNPKAMIALRDHIAAADAATQKGGAA